VSFWSVPCFGVNSREKLAEGRNIAEIWFGDVLKDREKSVEEMKAGGRGNQVVWTGVFLRRGFKRSDALGRESSARVCFRLGREKSPLEFSEVRVLGRWRSEKKFVTQARGKDSARWSEVGMKGPKAGKVYNPILLGSGVDAN